MTKAKKAVETLIREERQAAITVQSAKEVLAEIESLKGLINDENLPLPDRREAKRSMLDASERLCNLMGLAVFQLTNGVNSEFQGRMKNTLDALRSRLLDMGTNLMIDKLSRIHDRAETVLEGRAYPLGLAAKLDMAYSGIVDNLKTLGAMERLGDPQRELVDTTARDIRSLADIEQSLGVMEEMESAPRLRRQPA